VSNINVQSLEGNISKEFKICMIFYSSPAVLKTWPSSVAEYHCHNFPHFQPLVLEILNDYYLQLMIHFFS